MDYLPTDVVFEILSRTSLESLDSCKAVSKEWNQLVHNSDFMPTYCTNTNSTYGFFIQHPHVGNYVHKFISLERGDSLSINGVMKKEVKIEASSKQGLLCVSGFETRGNKRYYVCKPSTTQFQALPNPKVRYFTVNVALVVLHSDPLRYKIIRIFNIKRPRSSRNFNNAYRCEVFDSETWRWKRLSEDIVLGDDECFIPDTPSVQTSGLIYWPTERHVVAFDPADETHSRFPLPESKSYWDFSNTSVIEYEGKLGLTSSPLKENAELWVVDGSKTHSWRLMKEVKVPMDATGLPILGFYNRDIALLNLGSNGMVFYNLQNFSIKDTVVRRTFGIEKIFPFRSNSQPVNLRGA